MAKNLGNIVVMSTCLGPYKECVKLWKTQNAEMKNQGSTAFVKFKQILTSSSITYKQVFRENHRIIQ